MNTLWDVIKEECLEDLIEYCLFQEEDLMAGSMETESKIGIVPKPEPQQEWLDPDLWEDNTSHSLLINKEEDPFIGYHPIEDQILQPASPLKSEPRSVAFVGLEESNIRDINNTEFANYTNQWLENPIDINHYNQNFNHSTQYNNATTDIPYFDANSTFYQNNSFSSSMNFSNLQINDDHSQTVGVSNAIYAETSTTNYSFNPPSVHSSSSDEFSAWNQINVIEYSSSSEADTSASALSQEEILEEIYRECSEIERNSSASPPDLINKRGNAKSLTKLKSNKRATNNNKPYSRQSKRSSPEVESPTSSMKMFQDLDERKKELNRIAATKYREKKRQERESIGDTLKRMEARNIELKSETASIQTEIDYLKKLIKEIEDRTKN